MILGTPIQKQSLQKMVLDTLRQAILEREIKPGEQINIRKMAEKLAVSTMPIREALRELAAEGLITFQSNKRILANRLSRKEFYEIYAIRIPLEEMALLKCLERQDKSGIKRLEELHRQMSRNGVVGTEWFNLNRAFHMKLHEMSGSARLFQILQGLWNSTGPYLRLFSGREEAVHRANEEHAMILEAIRHNDPSQAKKILRSHLKNGLKTIEAALEEE
jgi:DNA-binding GntR family transcriptional regulator